MPNEATVKWCFRLILLTSILGISSFAEEKHQGPQLSEQNLTPEQIGVYRAFLDGYLAKGSRNTLNLSNRTYALDLSSHSRNSSCLDGIEIANLSEAQNTIHAIASQVVSGKRVRLVDPKQYVVSFDSGILYVSEIAFSKDRRFAVLSYHYYCGPLCGQGETMIFRRSAKGWKKTDRSCGGWLSGQPVLTKDQGL